MPIVTSITTGRGIMTPISAGLLSVTRPWMAAAGTLTPTITRMANIPIFTLVNTDPFVFTEASLDTE